MRHGTRGLWFTLALTILATAPAPAQAAEPLFVYTSEPKK
jgi:hypothetical protein